MVEGVATKIKDMDWPRKGGGVATLYRVDPPMPHDPWRDTRPSEYVIVSSNIVLMDGPETYIFSAGENGEITCWGEMDGSFKGALDHTRALAGAGYRIADAPVSEPTP